MAPEDDSKLQTGPHWGRAPDPRYTLALPRSPFGPSNLRFWIRHCVLHWFILNVDGIFFKTTSFSLVVFVSDAVMITVDEIQLKK
jgi:hypothetical protein